MRGAFAHAVHRIRHNLTTDVFPRLPASVVCGVFSYPCALAILRGRKELAVSLISLLGLTLETSPRK